MNGELKIIVTDASVQVTGYLNESGTMERVAIVDALMNAFDMKGDERELVCNMLLSVEKARTKLSEGDIDSLFEELLKNLTKEK